MRGFGSSPTQQDEIWRRWHEGQMFSLMGRAFRAPMHHVCRLLYRNDGVRLGSQQRSERHLTGDKRGDIPPYGCWGICPAAGPTAGQIGVRWRPRFARHVPARLLAPSSARSVRPCSPTADLWSRIMPEGPWSEQPSIKDQHRLRPVTRSLMTPEKVL